MEEWQKKFIPGIELNRLFYQQVVKPLLDEYFPEIKYSAGLVGEGSDVMGYDNPQSMDHNWGPHLRIFLSEADFKKRRKIGKMFRKRLPYNFMGFPTNFTKPDETSYLVQKMRPIEKGEVNHFIEFFTIKSFFKHYLGFNPYSKITYKDWLTFPQQALIEVTGGELYHDEIGLSTVREKFRYFPEEVWLYIYGHQWAYIGDEEMYMGRSGEIGDELGSNIIANRMANSIIKLCFLFEKKYIPYSKWIGTAFSRLSIANELIHPLYNMVTAKTWQEREDFLVKVYEIIGNQHNLLKITKHMQTKAEEHDRHHKILGARGIYFEEIAKTFSPYFSKLKYQVGSIDQFIAHSRINHMDYIAREFVKIIK